MAVSTTLDGPSLVSPPNTVSKLAPRRRPASKRPSQDENRDPQPAARGREDEEEEDDADVDEEAGRAPAKRTGRRKIGGDSSFTSPINLPEKDEDVDVFLANISADDWPLLIAYIWRTDPVANLTVGGRASHIRKFTTPFDKDELKKLEGSGGYRVDFCGIDRDTRKQKRIAQWYFEINDPDYPPRMPYGPWIDAPENSKWLWCKPRLLGAPEEIAAPAGGGGNESASAVIRATVAALNSQQTNSNQLNDLAARALDPNYNLAMLKSMKDILGGRGEGSSETHAILLMMLENGKEERNLLREEIRELRNSRAEAATQRSAADLLREQVEIKQLARQLAGGSGAAKDDDSIPGWAKGIIEVLGPPLGAILASRFAGPSPSSPSSPSSPHPPQSPQSQQQRQMPPASSTGQPGQPNQQEHNPDMMDPRTLKLIKHQQILGEISPFLVDHFVNGVGEPEQSSGTAFRDWFFDRHGEDAWNALKVDLTPEFICEFVGATPQFANALHVSTTDNKLDASGTAELMKFMQDFYTTPSPEPANA